MSNIIKQDISVNPCIQWTTLIMGYGLARRVEELEKDEEIGLEIFGLGKSKK